MNTNENKSTIVQYYQAFNNGEDHRFGEFFADDFLDHNGYPDQPLGPNGVIDGYRVWRDAFPDPKAIIEDIIAEEDKVVIRVTGTGTHQGEFFGIPATGKKIEIGSISIFRVVDGRIKERWGLTEAEKLTRTLQEYSLIPKIGKFLEFWKLTIE